MPRSVDRELLEQAEINELQGCVRYGLNFNNAARESLAGAQADYQRVLDSFEQENTAQNETCAALGARLLPERWERGDPAELQEIGLARATSALQDGVCKL